MKFLNKFFYSLLSLFLSTNFSFSQAPTFLWNNQFSGFGRPYSITEDVNENIIVYGNFSQTMDFDPGSLTQNLTAGPQGSFFIQKLNSNGNLIWVKQLNFEFNLTDTDGYGLSVVTDNLENIYFSGVFHGTIDFDPSTNVNNLTSDFNTTNGQYEAAVFVCKLNSNGTFQWVKSFDINSTFSAQRHQLFCDNSNNVYLTGDFGNGISDLDPGPNIQEYIAYNSPVKTSYFVKLDSNGNHLFSMITPINSSEYDFNPKQNAFVNMQGEIFCAGQIQNLLDIDPSNNIQNVNPIGVSDGIFCKYNTSGQLLWYKKFDALNSSFCKLNNIKQAENGDIFVRGFMEGTVDFDPSSQNFFVTKTSSFFIGKYKSNGDFCWVKTWDIEGQADFELEQVEPLNDGNIFVIFSLKDNLEFDVDPGVGVINYSSPTLDFYGVGLILDSLGNYLWSKQIAFPNEQCGFLDLHSNSTNHVLLAGYFGGTISLDPSNSTVPLFSNSEDGFIVKYELSGIADLSSRLFTDFSIYPNPTTDIVNLNTEYSFKSKFKIFDASGRCVLNGSIEVGELKIDVSTLETGLYTLDLEGYGNSIMFSKQ